VADRSCLMFVAACLRQSRPI